MRTRLFFSRAIAIGFTKELGEKAFCNLLRHFPMLLTFLFLISTSVSVTLAKRAKFPIVIPSKMYYFVHGP